MHLTLVLLWWTHCPLSISSSLLSAPHPPYLKLDAKMREVTPPSWGITLCGNSAMNQCARPTAGILCPGQITSRELWPEICWHWPGMFSGETRTPQLSITWDSTLLTTALRCPSPACYMCSLGLNAGFRERRGVTKSIGLVFQNPHSRPSLMSSPSPRDHHLTRESLQWSPTWASSFNLVTLPLVLHRNARLVF